MGLNEGVGWLEGGSDLTRWRGLFPSVDFSVMDGELLLGAAGEPSVVRVYEDGGRWTVSTDEWHGHFEDPDEAVRIGVELLAGVCRTAQEFRGEKLSATWLEIFDGDAYEVRNVAFFLSPFDRGEWELRPGEAWRVKRTHRRLVELPDLFGEIEGEGPFEFVRPGEVSSTEMEVDEPFIYATREPLKWYEQELGPPLEGMRWTHSDSRQFVFQAPSGWRLEEKEDKESKDSMFSPVDRWAGLRVRTFFRDSETPGELAEGPVGPVSVEHLFEEVCSHAPEWRMHQWTLIFNDGVWAMLAQVYLYQPHGSEGALDSVAAKIEESLPLSRFVPAH